jgi:hypothetical protein
MARKPKSNGGTQEVAAAPGGALLDLEKMPPAAREFLAGVFRTTGAAAAAAMAAETERHEQARPEFYGTAPTDLRRQFSTARPRQGAGLPPRKANGHI